MNASDYWKKTIQSVLCSALLCASMRAQDAPKAGTQAPRIEVEFVTVNQFGAYPSTITRPVGKFYLVLTNQRLEPLSLTVESASLPTLVTGLIQSLGLSALSGRRRIAGLIDVPAGSFQIKNAANKKTLCQITLQ